MVRRKPDCNLLGSAQPEVARRGAQRWLRQLARQTPRAPRQLAGALSVGARRAQHCCRPCRHRAADLNASMLLLPRRGVHNRFNLRGRKVFKAEVV